VRAGNTFTVTKQVSVYEYGVSRYVVNGCPRASPMSHTAK